MSLFAWGGWREGLGLNPSSQTPGAHTGAAGPLTLGGCSWLCSRCSGIPAESASQSGTSRSSQDSAAGNRVGRGETKTLGEGEYPPETLQSSPAGIQLYPPEILGVPEVRCCNPLPSQTSAPTPFEEAFRGGSAAGAPCALGLPSSPKRNSTRPWSTDPLSCPHTPCWSTCGDIGTSMGNSATTLSLQTQSTRVGTGTPSSSPHPPLHQGCQGSDRAGQQNPQPLDQSH